MGTSLSYSLQELEDSDFIADEEAQMILRESLDSLSSIEMVCCTVHFILRATWIGCSQICERESLRGRIPGLSPEITLYPENQRI